MLAFMLGAGLRWVGKGPEDHIALKLPSQLAPVSVTGIHWLERAAPCQMIPPASSTTGGPLPFPMIIFSELGQLLNRRATSGIEQAPWALVAISCVQGAQGSASSRSAEGLTLERIISSS